MHSRRIARREVLQVSAIPLQIDPGHMHEMHVTTDSTERSVKIVPLIFDLPRYDRAHALNRPHAPQIGVQPKAGFVHKPHLHLAPSLDLQGFKLFGHAAFERLGRVGIFPGVTGPRHPQHPPAIFLASSTPWHTVDRSRAL